MLSNTKSWIILLTVVGGLGAVTTAVVLSMDTPVNPNETVDPPVPPEVVTLHGSEHPDRRWLSKSRVAA